MCHVFEPLPQILRNVRYKTRQAAGERQGPARHQERPSRALNGKGRLVIRPSGTEPVIRVMAEGDDSRLVEDVVDGIVEALTGVAA